MKRVLLADGNYLVREGLKAILGVDENIEIAGEAESSEDLLVKASAINFDLLIIDFTSPQFDISDLKKVKEGNPDSRILAITTYYTPGTVLRAIESGISGYILKDCGKEEVVDAVKYTSTGDNFFCGKIIESIVTEEAPNNVDLDKIARCCEPVHISDREIDIVKLIAEGYTNKQIADKLHISKHTVVTHRKNIMSKLGVNNTAGVVVYAIKQSIINPE